MIRVGLGRGWVLGVFALTLIGCSAIGGVRGLTTSEASEWTARDAAIMAVLDRYLAGLNALDLEAHVTTYHFPHFRYASGEISVWKTALEAIPILDVPEAERLRAVRAALEPEWVRSEWRRREIVQGDDEKVHVATRFVRLRADGSVIKTFDSLYVMTFEADDAGSGAPRWAIKGRSSFAP